MHVIPHGAFEHLAAGPAAPTLAAAEPASQTHGAASAADARAPVVLCFGLMRPYKGIDLLLDAWGDGLDGAELWIVGMARMDTSALRARAPASVRFDERFVADEELPALFARAEIVVLPYREAEASGVCSPPWRWAGRCC